MSTAKSIPSENALSRERGAERIRTAESDRSAETRGTKADKLVEALRKISCNVHGAGAERYAASLARKALTEWEQA
jgi:hypothetical protein